MNFTIARMGVVFVSIRTCPNLHETVMVPHYTARWRGIRRQEGGGGGTWMIQELFAESTEELPVVCGETLESKYMLVFLIDGAKGYIFV